MVKKKKTVQQWLDEGVTARDESRWDDLITAFTNAIALLENAKPLDRQELAAVYNDRGNAYANKGEYDIAIKDYDKAIELKPDYANAYNGRGIAYHKKGEYDIAIENFNRAIELKPDDADAYNNRGVAWRGKNEYDKAIADYNEAIKLKPDYAEAYNNRGNARDKKGEYGTAMEDFNKAIELKPDYANAYSNRGVAMGKQAAQKLGKQFKTDTEEDEKVEKKYREKAEKLSCFFTCCLILAIGVFSSLAIIILCYVIDLIKNDGLLIDNLWRTSLAFMPYISLIVFFVVWGLRVLDRSRKNAEILSQVFSSNRWVEGRITAFHAGDVEWQKNRYEDYIKHRMKEGPEHMLLELYGKGDKSEVSHPTHIIIDKALSTIKK